MGKFILCSGETAGKPLHFTMTGTDIYSIEELCYYLYENIYTMTEEDFNKQMLEWLSGEAGMEELARKLARLSDGKGSLKDMVVSVLCSADYYTEPEIKELIRLMDSLDRMPAWKRLKIKGDNYFKYRNYTAAIAAYDSILKGPHAASLKPADFGDVLHNRSAACLHTASFQEAAEGFEGAYAGNQNPESLKAYLTALYLSKSDKAYLAGAEKHGMSGEELGSLTEEIKTCQMEAEELAIYKELKDMEELKAEGRVGEYYEGLKALICRWKQEYRKEIGNCSYELKDV